jgi:hypothetical protein
MLQLPVTASARRAGRDRSARYVPMALDRSSAARVSVAWVSADQAPGLAPTELELVAGLETASPTKWTCQQRFASDWLEALASARCSEVVLTAQLDDDPPAKHRVLELAELLTLELCATQPLIRVRFLPTAAASFDNHSRNKQRRARNPT